MTDFLLIGLGAGACLGGLIGYWGKRTTTVRCLKLNPYRGSLYGAILGLFFAAVPARLMRSESVMKPSEQGKASNSIAASKTTTPSHGSGVVHVNSEVEFERCVLQASKPCLADFYSNRCPPCRMLAPIIEGLAGKYQGRAVICKVSLDYTPRLAGRYNIMGIPAVLFFRGGKEVNRLVGLRRQDDYERVLERMIEKQ